MCVLAGTAFGGVGAQPHPDLVRQLPRESHGGPERIRASSIGAAPSRSGADAGPPLRDRPRPSVASPRSSSRASSPTRACAASPTPPTPRSGRTSCRRPATSSCASIEGCDGVLTLLTDRVDDEFLDRAGPGLKVVSNFAVGFDNIDVAGLHGAAGPGRATRPGVLTETTADLACALLMAAARRVVEGDRYVRDGKWKTWGPMLLLGPDVHGATIGIVGLRADRPGDGPAREGLRHADRLPRPRGSRRPSRRRSARRS